MNELVKKINVCLDKQVTFSAEREICFNVDTLLSTKREPRYEQESNKNV